MHIFEFFRYSIHSISCKLSLISHFQSLQTFLFFESQFNWWKSWEDPIFVFCVWTQVDQCLRYHTPQLSTHAYSYYSCICICTTLKKNYIYGWALIKYTDTIITLPQNYNVLNGKTTLLSVFLCIFFLKMFTQNVGRCLTVSATMRCCLALLWMTEGECKYVYTHRKLRSEDEIVPLSISIW